jgi:hypothetical protein
MNRIAGGLKPKGGISSAAHFGLVILLPVLLYVMIRIDFIQLALLLVILSKWRMFAVRMRYWPANIRANAVDLMVGISAVIFMASTNTGLWQLIWALLYGVWLIFIKPRSSTLFISLQAGIAQFVALMAMFLTWGDAHRLVLVFVAWLICYLCARHFFTNFDEPYTSLYSHTWGYFGAALVWILSHWLLFYGQLAQPTLLLGVIGFGVATLYYLDQDDRLSSAWRRQFVLMMVAIVVVVLTFSDWGDRAL